MSLLHGIMFWENSSQFGCLCRESEYNRDRVSLGLEEVLLLEIKVNL